MSGADATAEIAGANFQHGEVRQWTVPYCGTCLHHVATVERINSIVQEIPNSAMRRAELTVQAQRLEQKVRLNKWCPTEGVACFGVAFAISFIAVSFLPSMYRKDEGLRFFATVSSIIFTVFFFCTITWIGVMSRTAQIVAACSEAFYNCIRESGRISDDITALEKESESLGLSLPLEIKENCSCDSSAIVYAGWAGTKHTFRFANADFADLFFQANKDKIVM